MVLLVATVLAGCASTTQRRDDLGAPAAGVPAGVQASDSTASTGLGPTGATGAPVDTSSGAAAGGSTDAASVPSAPGEVPTGASAAPPIKLGVRFTSSKGTAAFATAMGISGVAPGDTRELAQAMVDELNTSGGIAGRRIDPYYVEYDLSKTLSGNAAAEHQRHCEAFAYDGRVFAAVSPLPAGELLPRCLGDRGIPYIQDSVGWYFDDDVMAQVPDLYTPAAPNSSRVARFWVRHLDAQRYFDAGAKIGVVRLGGPAWDRLIEQDLVPALRAIGRSVTTQVVITDPQQIGAGLVRFRADGVTHVLIMDDNGLLATLWMNQSESQGYRPRYGLNSINAPVILERNVPPAQLARSIGIGWSPAYDVSGRGERDRPSAEDQRCADVMRRHGLRLDDRTRYSVALYTCDVFWFLKAAVERAAEVSPAALRGGVAGLGSAYRPAGTYGATFGAGRRDGTNAVRPFAFAGDCTCFRYTGPPMEAT